MFETIHRQRSKVWRGVPKEDRKANSFRRIIKGKLQVGLNTSWNKMREESTWGEESILGRQDLKSSPGSVPWIKKRRWPSNNMHLRGKMKVS